MIRMRRPIGPHVRSNQAALGTDHLLAQRSNRRFVWQPIRSDHRAMMAPTRAAIDQQLAATVATDMSQRDRRECLALAWRHHDPTMAIDAAESSGCWPRSGP